MINLSLDKFDFLSAIEGFANGSHLRQHVWKEIVYRSIPQMSEDDMDFFWFYMRRDIFENYFYEINGKKHTRFGYRDFMHALAALHRGNRYDVVLSNKISKEEYKVLCYRFDGEFRPLYIYDGNGRQRNELQPFDCFVGKDCIVNVQRKELPYNYNVEEKYNQWWSDLEIYDNFEKKLL